jgi:hypothetical protein
MKPAGEARAARAAPLALAFAIAGLLGAWGALARIGELRALGFAALALGGAGYPLLLRIAAPRPSWLKLAVLAWLVSPLLVCGAELALCLALPREAALAAALALGALAQLLARGREVRLERPGGAALAALALGLAAAFATWLLVMRGNAARVSYHGLLHAGVVESTLASLPPENPWLAGRPLPYYWLWHALCGAAGEACGLAPTRAMAWSNVWAAAALAPALFLALAPLWPRALGAPEALGSAGSADSAESIGARGRGARLLAGVALALLGLNVLGGWVWLARGLPGGRAMHSSLDLFDSLAPLLVEVDGGWIPDRRTAFGWSKLGNLSSYPAALALVAGGWLAAAHALRHGARPWPLLAGALIGAALAVNPVVGGTALVGTALAALAPSIGARARRSTLAWLALGALPGLALVVQAGGDYQGTLARVALDRTALAGTLWHLLPLAAGAAFLARAREPASERAVVALLGANALAGALLAAFAVLPEDNQYKGVRVAALALGLLAGAGIAEGLCARPARRAGRAGALAIAALVAVGALAANVRGFASYAAFARLELPLADDGGALAPRGPHEDPRAAELEGAYAWLREHLAGDARRPLLVANVFPEAVAYGQGVERARFIEPDNRQGHEVVAFARLPLWVDRKFYLVENDPAWERRLTGVAELFRDATDWHPAFQAELTALGRPVAVLATSADLAANPALAAKLERAGFAPVAGFVSPSGARLWAWPREFAAEERAP